MSADNNQGRCHLHSLGLGDPQLPKHVADFKACLLDFSRIGEVLALLERERGEPGPGKSQAPSLSAGESIARYKDAREQAKGLTMWNLHPLSAIGWEKFYTSNFISGLEELVHPTRFQRCGPTANNVVHNQGLLPGAPSPTPSQGDIDDMYNAL